MARFTLKHQQSRPKLPKVQIKVRKAFKQELDPVQTGARRAGEKCIRVGLHVMRVDDEDRVKMIRPFASEFQGRIIMDPKTLSEPH